MSIPSHGQSYFTLAWLVADDGARFAVTLEWDGHEVREARRQVAIPPWEDSVYARIELPPRTLVDCPQMSDALRDLEWQVVERRAVVAGEPA